MLANLFTLTSFISLSCLLLGVVMIVVLTQVERVGNWLGNWADEGGVVRFMVGIVVFAALPAALAAGGASAFLTSMLLG